ncbi:MAG: type II toxin-antitoxin system RelE/ParE family toxin [Phenylobacterium sp.]|nr:type II toxin-antitoxin system RelE/ParE family toxin [Phenylobacterium sp.]MBX3484653.1 type II toxin-antitoxin system RelE/ParE family toxin [Phenylobacterium sp.]
MRGVVWSPRALVDLAAIEGYVASFNPLAARALADRLISAANGLVEFPERGVPASRGTRHLTIVRPYLIRYRVRADRIEIVTIRHGARRPL